MKQILRTLLTLAFASFATSGAFAQFQITVNPPSPIAGIFSVDPVIGAPGTGWGFNDIDTVQNRCGNFLVLPGDSLACNAAPVASTPNIAGKIVIVTRGTCEFGVKAKNVQDAGGIGCIIVENPTRIPLAGGIGPGTVGAQVTIPTYFITVALGDTLKKYTRTGDVNGCLGSVINVYGNNLALQFTLLSRPPFAQNVDAIVDTGDFAFQPGAFVVNRGSITQTGVTLRARVLKYADNNDSTEIYNQSVLLGDIVNNTFGTPSTDTVGEILPRFDLVTLVPPSQRKGKYTLRYNIEYGNIATDGVINDNTYRADFFITDSIVSRGELTRSGVNGILNTPLVDGYFSAGTTLDRSYSWGIGYQAPASVSSQFPLLMKFIDFSATVSALDKLSFPSTVVNANVSEWNDANGDEVIETTELTQVGSGSVTFGDTLQREQPQQLQLFDASFDQYVRLTVPNQKYIVTLEFAGTYQLFLNTSTRVSYTRQQQFEAGKPSFIAQSPVRQGTGWSDGFTDASSGLILHVTQGPTASRAQGSISSLRAYPQPAQNEIRVSVSDKVAGATTFTLTDLQGRVVLQTKEVLATGTSISRINTSSVKAGMYNLTVQTTGGVSTQKISIVR
jgi:hypothetical protein